MRNLLICVLAVLTLTASPSYAQPDIVKRPVQFAKGQSGATIKSGLTGDQTVDCTLRAAAGQTMFVGSSDGSRSNSTLAAAIAGGSLQPVAASNTSDEEKVIEASARASQGRFNATGRIACAQNRGQAVSANLSQADGDMGFGAIQEADLHMIRAGHERYEIPEAVISGG